MLWTPYERTSSSDENESPPYQRRLANSKSFCRNTRATGGGGSIKPNLPNPSCSSFRYSFPFSSTFRSKLMNADPNNNPSSSQPHQQQQPPSYDRIVTRRLHDRLPACTAPLLPHSGPTAQIDAGMRMDRQTSTEQGLVHSFTDDFLAERHPAHWVRILFSPGQTERILVVLSSN